MTEGGGVGLFSKPKVTPCTVGHFGGKVGVSQKVTKSDGVGGGRISDRSQAMSFMALFLPYQFKLQTICAPRRCPFPIIVHSLAIFFIKN